MTGDDEEPPRKRRLRPRDLTEAEAQLWHGLAATVKPLRRQRERAPPGSKKEAHAETSRRREHAVAAPPSPPSMARRDTPRAARPEPPPSSAPKTPPIAAFERRVVRKVAKGALEIDDRLDLHGATQEIARQRLRGFILGAHQKGLKLVLVITGKGRAKSDDSDPWKGTEPGVLRRAVPLWLGEGELRHAVLSFTSAHARHGGDGALYVRLRRPKDRAR